MFKVLINSDARILSYAGAAIATHMVVVEFETEDEAVTAAKQAIKLPGVTAIELFARRN